jgi:hypothetical protein
MATGGAGQPSQICWRVALPRNTGIPTSAALLYTTTKDEGNACVAHLPRSKPRKLDVPALLLLLHPEHVSSLHQGWPLVATSMHVESCPSPVGVCTLLATEVLIAL